MSLPQLLYCHCAYARVVPAEVKQEVLRRLSESGRSFDAVADLCEMSAKCDPSLEKLGGRSELKIAACYPRAVKWLFASAGVTLAEDAAVLNMRTQTADEIIAQLLEGEPSSSAEAEE